MAVAAAILAALGSSACEDEPVPPPPPRPPVARATPAPMPPETVAGRRNPFAYPTPPAAPVPVTTLAARPRPLLPPPTAPPAPRVQLVGFVTRGGAPHAVLRADGETWVSGVGDRVGGYVVTAIEDESVRLRRPDGEELVLHAAS